MPRSGTPNPPDDATLDALAAWGGDDPSPTLARFTETPPPHLAPPGDPLDRLRRALDAQRDHDPARVHPSWYVRALQDESIPVRRVVLGGIDEPLRSEIVRAIGLDSVHPDGPADPEAVALVRSLWSDRLVGDLPTRPDDPAAIVALSTLGPVALYRVARRCGRIKRAFADEPPAGAEPRLALLAARDGAAVEPLGRHRLAGLGLTTVGRLLGQADPHRVRWALQHVPYPIAKRLRAAASGPEASVRAVRRWEAEILDAALAPPSRRSRPA